MSISEGDPKAFGSQVIIVTHLAHRVRCRACRPAIAEELIANRVPISDHAKRMVDLAVHEWQRPSCESIASPGTARTQLDIPNLLGIEIQRAFHIDDQCQALTLRVAGKSSTNVTDRL